MTRIRIPAAEATLRTNAAPACERRPHLEVRRPRAAERARAEERPAEVRRAAARPGDDAARRAVERKPLPRRRRRPARARRWRAPSRRRGAVSAIRGRTRGAGTSGSPSRPGARGGSRTRAARRPTRRGRGGTRPRRGRAGGPRRPCGRAPRAPRAGRSARSARPPRARRARRRRASRCSQERALEREQPALQAPAGRPVAAELVRLAPAGGDDAVARDDEREAVGGAEAARGAGGARPPGERGEPAVGPTSPQPTVRIAASSSRWKPLSPVRRARRRRSAPACPAGAPRTAGTDPARSRHPPVTALRLA